MLIHSDILLFELIKLSVEGTDNNLINITKLKNAYTNFIKILENHLTFDLVLRYNRYTC